MSKTTTRESPLLQAVQALDAELERFEQLAASAERVPLTSERNIDKAARTINEAAESQQRVGAHITALIEAITTARQNHDATAQKVIALREKLQARAALVNQQLERFGQLGREATEISGLVRQFGLEKGQKPSAETVQKLGDVATRMEQVIGAAQALSKEAHEQDMDELARQCDALKQQVQAALNKVTLLRDKLAAAIN